MTLGCLQQLRWDQAFVRRDSARLRLIAAGLRCLALVLICAGVTPSPGVGQESRARGRTGCPSR